MGKSLIRVCTQSARARDVLDARRSASGVARGGRHERVRGRQREACIAHTDDKPSTPWTYNQVFEVALGDGRVHFGEVDAFGLVVWWRYTRRAVLVLGPSLQANKQYLRAFQAEVPWSVRAVARTTGVRRAQ